MSNPRPEGRRSIRLPHFDYSQPNSYYLTICSANRECTFSKIMDGKVCETALGTIIRACWLEIPEHFPTAETGSFVIMPNHVHGLLTLKKGIASQETPRLEAFTCPTVASIPTIVRSFKAAVTRHFRHYDPRSATVWQRDYYERVVRTSKELAEIARYIENNPRTWEQDEDHPNHP